MADKKLNENQLPSCSVSNNITYPKLGDVKKNVTKKRTFSELKDQYEVNDLNESENTKHKFKKKKILQSNALEMSLSVSQFDAIKKLKRRIEKIENELFKKTFIGETKTKDRDSQSLTNDEIQVLLESSFNKSEIIQEKQLSESLEQISNVEKLDNNLKSHVDQFDDLNDSIKCNDDVIMLNREVDAFISNINETYKNFNMKNIFGQRDNLSKSIQYLYKIILEDLNNNFSVNIDEKCENNLKSDFDQVEESNNSLKRLDDVILLNREIDAFISNDDETYKSCNLMKISNQKDSQKLKKNVHDVIMLDNEKNLSKIDDINENTNMKSIHGQEEKLSPSILYLKDKTVLEDVNFHSKNSLIDQELSKPSNNLHGIVTPNDENLHTTKINNEIITNEDSISINDVLIEPFKHEDDLIMLDTENFDCCIIENDSVSIHGLKRVNKLSENEIDVIHSSNCDTVNNTREDTFHKTYSKVIDVQDNIIDLTNNPNYETLLENDNDILWTNTNNETNGYDGHKNHKECPKTSVNSPDVIFLDGDIDLTKINDTEAKNSSSIANLKKINILELSKNVEDTILLSDDEDSTDFTSNENDEKICESNPTSDDGQFSSQIFFFGSENFRDVLLYDNDTTPSPKRFLTKNCTRKNFSTNSNTIQVNFSSKTSENLANENQAQNKQKIDSSSELSISSIRCNQIVNSFVNEVVIDSQNLSLEPIDKNVSFTPNKVQRSLENSESNFETSDDSLIFMPSKKDLLKYVINSSISEEEKSISKSLNTSLNLSNNIKNISQENLSLNTPKSPLKSSGGFNNVKVNVLKSFVKDSEDNITSFYDCDLSSIENSDAEDNILTLSFEDEFELNHWSFENNNDKTQSTKELSLHDQSKHNKDNNLDFYSKSCDTTTDIEYHNTSIDFLDDHKYHENFSGNMSKIQNYNDYEVPVKDNIQCQSVNPFINSWKLNPKNNTLESLNYSNMETLNGCKKFKFNDPDITIDIDSLYEDHSVDNCNNEINKYPESKFKTFDIRNISDEKLDVEKSISSSKTVNKSYKNIKSENFNQLNVEASDCCTVPKCNNVVDIIDNIQFDNIDHSNLNNEIVDKPDKKKDEKFDEHEPVSPFITQSVTKTMNSQNLKKALAKKASANLSIKDMGNKALCTYLTQQTLTLDVLKILHKSLDSCPLPDVLMDDPKGLMVPLMPHQKHAIGWLMWRESQIPFGGILADDMGLGKTLSMISLVLKSEEKLNCIPFVLNNGSKKDIVNGGTLVVCPASLLNQWENEVKTKLSPGSLKVGQYYGVKRSISASELAKNDIVTTSYHVIMWDFKKKKSSPLFHINWKRIILDEAHVIRNYKTQTCIAVCNLTSKCRWALTGTPIHNKEADFFTLLKFIRCKPFDDWTIWKRWVGNNDDTGRHRQSLLVKTLMLRRTKEELSQLTSFKLPGKNFSTIEIELSKEERNAYEQLLKFSSKLFATYLYDKASKEKLFDHSIKVQCTVQYFQEQSLKEEEIFRDHPELQKLFKEFKNIRELQTYHILVLLLRLRQMCCHPCLIKGKVTKEIIDNDEKDNALDDENITDNDAIESASCYEKSDQVPTEDLISVEELTNNMSCLTFNKSKCNQKDKVIDSDFIFKKSWLSSKIKAVCSMVREKVLINDCKEKAIIVSQWPSMLRIIRQHLSEYKCEMEMYSGDVPLLKRNSIVREFNNINGGPQILLLSLMAGGVGLNLNAANHMFLVDVHWNPQLEAQACDRIYRLGQMKPVHIYKFVCINTIETRILMIQSHKLEIAQTLFEGVKVNSSKITLDDLKHIFQCS